MIPHKPHIFRREVERMAAKEKKVSLLANLREKLKPNKDKPTYVDNLVEKGVEKGIFSFERRARERLPDAYILAGAGMLVLLLLGALFYLSRK